MDSLVITTFALPDQDEAKALILRGLEEHFGQLDLSLNPDLNDIARHYAAGIFLVAWVDGRLVGTGALIPERPGIGRIVRMSVAQERRRMGIASQLLQALLAHAREQGLHKIVLETTETWGDAICFYLRHGFKLTHHADGDAHFEMEI